MKKCAFLLIILQLLLFLSAQSQQITFTSGDDLTLNGTLSLPIGDAPFPMVILVHGSGPSDRDQTVRLQDGNSFCLYPELFGQTIRNFADIADYLTARGIAVLRYDKRTFTHGQTLDPATILVSDFAEDIKAAIDYVSELPTIDVERIYLAGHSQGSTIIPVAAIETQQVRGLISLAGPTTPIDEVLPRQIKDIYVQCANDPASGNNVATQYRTQFQEIRMGTFPLEEQIMIRFPGSSTPVPQGYGRFWKDWIDLSDSVIVNYQRAALPTLVIQGLADFNVKAADTLDFVEGLNNDLLTVKTYTGVNHFLTPVNDNQVAESILSDIADWIKTDVTPVQNILYEYNLNIIQSTGELIFTLPSEHPFEQLNLFDTNGRLLRSMKINQSTIQVTRRSLPATVVVQLSGKKDVYARTLIIY